MPDTREKWLELCIVEQLGRVSAGTDLTTKMLQRSREKIAKSLDILRSSEVPKVWHPEPFFGGPNCDNRDQFSHREKGRDISLAINRE
jgi:hypothetical protein